MGVSTAFAGSRPTAPRRWSKSLEATVTQRLRPFRDAIINRKHVQGERRFLILRHRAGLPSYYSDFLNWIERELPDVRSMFELRLAPCRIQDWSKYCLVVPWLPDTLMYRSSSALHAATSLVCDADLNGVPVINRPERLLCTSKHDCAAQLQSAGIRTPYTTHIDDIAEFRRNLSGRSLPLLIREDLAHGGWSPVFMIQTREDLNAVPLEQFERPIAVEFVDVRSANDGLVRKYRYMQIGNTGVSHSLQISKHWEVRSGARLLNDRTIAEEVEYAAQPDPNQEILRKASRSLGLDFLAFDYSYDVNGKLIVWEVNVLPGLGLPKGPQREHLKIPVERAMASTVRMYLRRAGCEIPFRVQEIINFGSQNPVAA